MQPKFNLQQPDVLNEDANSLSAAITKKIPGVNRMSRNQEKLSSNLNKKKHDQK